MEPSAFLSEPATSPGTIAILGARPAGLVLAFSLPGAGCPPPSSNATSPQTLRRVSIRTVPAPSTSRAMGSRHCATARPWRSSTAAYSVLRASKSRVVNGGVDIAWVDRIAGRSGESIVRSFDLLVGADGAGSTVRSALQARISGFAVTSKSFPNYCTMIELDKVGGRPDKN